MFSGYGKTSKREIILEVCEMLAEENGLKLTLIEAAKGSSLIGLASFAGSLLGGKPGMIIGSAVGTLASSYLISDFKSVVQVLREMPRDKRNRLVKCLNDTLKDVDFKNVTSCWGYLSENASVKQEILDKMGSFFKNEMDMDMSGSLWSSSFY